MKRDVRAYLFDIKKAAEEILRFTDGMSLKDYCRNELVKAAVERKFSVIGEALVQIRAEFPDLLEQISDSEKIIGFRNVLIHGYDAIEDATVWSAVTDHLKTMMSEVEVLLK